MSRWPCWIINRSGKQEHFLRKFLASLLTSHAVVLEKSKISQPVGEDIHFRQTDGWMNCYSGNFSIRKAQRSLWFRRTNKNDKETI